MNILGSQLSLEEFRQYVSAYNFGPLKPSSLVIHHTWSPTEAEWNGATTIQSLKKYYEGLGWSAGPHLFIAEDGVWLFTPMNTVGIHAGEGNATWSLPFGRTTQGFSKPFGGSLKSYSIGIEVVGDYDAEKWSGNTYSNAIGVIQTLLASLKIGVNDVYFHRDFPSAHKTCPGTAITKEWLAQQLVLNQPTVRPVKRLIQVSGKPEIFIWTGQKKFHIPDVSTLNFLFPIQDVELVEQSVLDSLEDGGNLNSLFT